MIGLKFNLEPFLSGKLFNLTGIELKTILEIFPVLIVLLGNVVTPKQRQFLQLCCDMFCVFRVIYMTAIPRAVLKELEPCIKDMVKRFEELTASNYTESSHCCTLPLHTLLHIVETIKRTGNLRAHWTWDVESLVKVMKGEVTPRRNYLTAFYKLRMRKYSYSVFVESTPQLSFGAVELRRPYQGQDLISIDSGKISHLDSQKIQGLIKNTQRIQQLSLSTMNVVL